MRIKLTTPTSGLRISTTYLNAQAQNWSSQKSAVALPPSTGWMRSRSNHFFRAADDALSGVHLQRYELDLPHDDRFR